MSVRVRTLIEQGHTLRDQDLDAFRRLQQADIALRNPWGTVGTGHRLATSPFPTLSGPETSTLSGTVESSTAEYTDDSTEWKYDDTLLHDLLVPHPDDR